LRQTLTDEARDDVSRAASAQADHDVHRPARVAFRSDHARQSRKQRGASEAAKESSAGKCHGRNPLNGLS
jgi:hypothetical protein